MDGGGLVSAAQNFYRRVLVRTAGGGGTRSKTRARRSASKLVTAPGLKRFERGIRQSIKSAHPCILFDLPVPRVGVKCAEPSAKCLQFRRRQMLDRAFNVFDLAHTNLIRVRWPPV